MKIYIRIIFAVVMSALIFSVPYASTIKKTNGNYLYVITSKNGHIKKLPTGKFQLIMQNVTPYVTYFSDRPKRLSGLMPTLKFVNKWNVVNNRLVKNPPNANIEGSSLHAIYHSQFRQFDLNVELLNPTYYKKNKTLVFDIQLMPGNAITKNDLKFDHTALFVDQVCLSCIGD